jgi:hypothetical protein
MKPSNCELTELWLGIVYRYGQGSRRVPVFLLVWHRLTHRRFSWVVRDIA